MEITVQPLDLENRGKKLTFRYETEGFYDTVLQKTPEGWAFSFRLKPFSAPVEKCFEDRLLSGWWRNPRYLAPSWTERWPVMWKRAMSGGTTGFAYPTFLWKRPFAVWA